MLQHGDFWPCDLELLHVEGSSHEAALSGKDQMTGGEIAGIRTTLDQETVLVLSTDGEFLKYLKSAR